MRLYIVCHDESTYEKTKRLCVRWESEFEIANKVRKETKEQNTDVHGQGSIQGPSLGPSQRLKASPILVPDSKFFDHAVYGILLEEIVKQDWIDEDYVGIVSYLKVEEHERIKNINWFKFLNMAIKEDLDFLSLYNTEFKKGRDTLPMIEASVHKYGLRFYRALVGLLEAMEISREMIECEYILNILSHDCHIFKPNMMEQFCKFFLTGVNFLQNDATLNKLFECIPRIPDHDSFPMENSMQYLVFDRLRTFFFYTIQARMGSIMKEIEEF